jgi:hypothetical protein
MGKMKREVQGIIKNGGWVYTAHKPGTKLEFDILSTWWEIWASSGGWEVGSGAP